MMIRLREITAVTPGMKCNSKTDLKQRDHSIIHHDPLLFLI